MTKSTIPTNLPTYVRQKIPDAKVPLKYDEALNAIVACRAVDETKYWADKSDALAAWAKIYKDDQVATEARKLKLHAYRRMGQLADQLQPVRTKHEAGQHGRPPGAPALLQQHGLSRDAAAKALRIGRAPEPQFETAVSRAQGVDSAARMFRGLGVPGKPVSSESWTWLSRTGAKLREVRMAFNTRPAKEVALGLDAGEVAAAHALAESLIEWLDEFEQYLPERPES